MTRIDRRSFLMAAAGAAALPPVLAHAASIDAAVRTGTIQDVEHVVIFMQENRSFDHYFGSMPGVRGSVVQQVSCSSAVRNAASSW